MDVVTVEIIDRFDHGFGWTAGADDPVYRTSHALVTDEEVWLIDPVDFPALDGTLDEYGTVAGAIVLMDRHKRDAATIADRHDVPVFLPEALEPIREAFDTPVERLGPALDSTGYEVLSLYSNRFWREAALYNPTTGTLVVPEALVTAPMLRAPDERVAVHPVLRPIPPRKPFEGLAPDRLLVGHGRGIFDDAPTALETGLARARANMPRVYWQFLREAVTW